MASTVKVSSRNQIVVPADVREELGVGPGDRLIVPVHDGDIVMAREPDDWLEYTRGLGSHIWRDVDPVEYVRRERGACPD